MKKTLLILVALVATLILPASMHADDEINAFVEGTVWIVEHDSFYTPGVDEVETITIEGETAVGGRACMNLWHSINGGAKSLLAYLYTEEEQVYFIRPNDTTQSYLFYDFGIQAKDSVRVWPLNEDLVFLFPGTPFLQRYKSSEIINNAGTDLEVLELEEYQYICGEPRVVSHWWIKGVGEIFSPLENCNLFLSTGGPGLYLVKVIIDDKTVYSVRPDDPTVITEIASDKEAPQYYDLQGRLVHHPAQGQLLIRR